jgi:predicted ferric reductase
MGGLSHRLPGNLKGQSIAGILVGGIAVYALGLSIIELVAAIDIRLATGQLSFSGDSSDPLYEAGGGLGFYAAQLLTLNFVLATRWRWMEKLFGGAERVYALHAFVGKTALTFVMLHTGMFIIQALPDWTLVGTYLLPGRDWAYTLGVIGTFGLLALVAITIWIKSSYRSWLKTHKLMIVPFLGGTLHAIILQSDWYMVLMAAIGTYAWFDSVVLLPRRGIRAKLTCARTLGDIRELVLEPELPLKNGHGQFVLVGHEGHRHPFSISGVSNSKVRISARKIGPFTRRLADIELGHTVTLHGPFGRFGSQIRSANGTQLWIAGGIGITPFLSSLQMLADIAPARSIKLIWSVRYLEDAVYRQEIEVLMARMPNARLTVQDSSRLGRLTAAVALTHGQPDHVFLCGPSAMTEQLTVQFLKSGLAAERITSERFAFR